MKHVVTLACALLLGPGLALAQEAPEPGDAPPEGGVEEVPAEEAPATEAPADGAAAGGVEEVAAEEAPPAEEGAAETASGGWGSGNVDVYYMPTFDIGEGSADERGDGFGGRAQWRFWKALAVSGEYSAHTTDADEKFSDQRFGLGAVVSNDSGDTGGLFLEYERLDLQDADRLIDGLALHGRMSHATNEWFRFYADIGYKHLEDEVEEITSFEFNAGAVVTFGPVGVFADWRRDQLEGKDSKTRSHLEVVRVGARWAFGGP